MNKDFYSIFSLSDSAIVVDFGNVINEKINQKALNLAYAIGRAAFAGIKDIVPAYSSVTVHYDVVEILKHSSGETAFSIMKESLKKLLQQENENTEEQQRQIKIPVCYDEEFGWDLKDIAKVTKLTVEEIIQIHTSKKYKVFMVGFLPGFAYMGEVDPRIAMPRKAEPRTKISQGYVGIAGIQTGIYPLTSPGGWQIIGRTPLQLFNRENENPVLFKAGDEVEFFSITANEFYNY